MATLETNFLWDIIGKDKTGQIPDIISGRVLKFNITNFIIRSTTIQFLVDSTKVSEFILQSDYKVFFEERLQALGTISNESFQNTVKDLNKWVSVINGFLQLPKAPQANFKDETEIISGICPVLSLPMISHKKFVSRVAIKKPPC